MSTSKRAARQARKHNAEIERIDTAIARAAAGDADALKSLILEGGGSAAKNQLIQARVSVHLGHIEVTGPKVKVTEWNRLHKAFELAKR